MTHNYIKARNEYGVFCKRCTRCDLEIYSERDMQEKGNTKCVSKIKECPCHWGDKNFDGKCYYSAHYNNCEHCVKLGDKNYNSGHSIDVNGNCNMGCC